MFSKKIKVVQIGSSSGILVPKTILTKYGLSRGSELVLEEVENGILLKKTNDSKLSWEDTFKDMSKANEKWDEWDVTLSDGLSDD